MTAGYAKGGRVPQQADRARTRGRPRDRLCAHAQASGHGRVLHLAHVCLRPLCRDLCPCWRRRQGRPARVPLVLFLFVSIVGNSLFAQLAKDESPMVRRAAASNLSEFLKTMSKAHVLKDGVALFTALASDEHVRQWRSVVCVGNADLSCLFRTRSASSSSPPPSPLRRSSPPRRARYFLLYRWLN